jgi:hypothetical protein
MTSVATSEPIRASGSPSADHVGAGAGAVVPDLSHHDRQYLLRVFQRVHRAIASQDVPQSPERMRLLERLDAVVASLKDEAKAPNRQSIELGLLIGFAALKKMPDSAQLHTLVKGTVWRYFKRTLP